MNVDQILKELDRGIERLQRARAVLTNAETTAKAAPAAVKRGRPAGSKSVAKVVAAPAARTVSDEARAKMAAGQKARWLKVKRAAKREERKAALAVAPKPVVARREAVKAVPAKPTAVKKAVAKKVPKPVVAKKVVKKAAVAVKKQLAKKASTKAVARKINAVNETPQSTASTLAPAAPATS